MGRGADGDRAIRPIRPIAMERSHVRTIFLLLSIAVVAWLLAATPAETGSPSLAPESSASPHPAYLPLIMQPEATATATPSPTPTATPTVGSPAWLEYLNRFRSLAALSGLQENSGWTYGEWLHSRYMVKENSATHSEDPGSPWYTEEGDTAGRNGNIFVTSWTDAPDNTAIDFWMSGPFHAVAILDPQLAQTALGTYREDDGGWTMGATLDWARGLGALPPEISFPIAFPGDGSQTWLRQHPGYEWPDPLTSCPGYTAPSGPPLILQLGSGEGVPQVTAHSFMRGETPLPHCVFDETTYSNPQSGTQNSGRQVLNSRDAVVLMPQHPLQIGQTYRASITANGQTTEWQFTVIAPPPGAPLTLPREGHRFQTR